MLRAIPRFELKARLNRVLDRWQPHESWLSAGFKKKRVIVVGTGWGSFSFALRLNKQLYDLTVVSPRNHFLFTPLLTSTTVGTLEFRAITEPIRALPDLHSYQMGRCMDIDTEQKQILVRDSFDVANKYWLPYDVLIYGVGAAVNTFGIPGVKENAHFCRQIRDAMAIRNKIVELFECASKPNSSREEQSRLLSFVIVGGGPTSIEFAAELYDWLMHDGIRMFPELLDAVSVTLIEATNRVLPAFSQDLAEYTVRAFRKRRIRVLLNSVVSEVHSAYVRLDDGYRVPYGLMVWATGVAPVPLTASLSWAKAPKNGRILTDDFQRVCLPQTTAAILGSDSVLQHAEGSEFSVLKDVFAIGDCARNETRPLAPTAQTAKHQGYYVAGFLNQLTMQKAKDFESLLSKPTKKFRNTNRGMMAYIGGNQAAVSIGDESKDAKMHPLRKRLRHRLRTLTGLRAWFVWRSAYFSMTVSWPNRMLIATHWLGTLLFGRSFSRF